MNLWKRTTGGGLKSSPRVYTSPTGDRFKLYAELLNRPHLMIAGATGSGKSVVINALIYTALYQHPGDQRGGVGFILIDPKRVELVQYRELPHVLAYASEPADRLHALRYAMQLCENRYKITQKDKRHSLREWDGGDIYVIIDEFADLMTTQRRDVMPIIQRLAQIGRAAHVHIILATQTPIAKIIPTEIKCNFDYRVGLRTDSAQGSRNILGLTGCETLPDPKATGAGYGYYKTGADCTLYRLPMIEEKELAERVTWWTDQARPHSRSRNRLA